MKKLDERFVKGSQLSLELETETDTGISVNVSAVLKPTISGPMEVEVGKTLPGTHQGLYQHLVRIVLLLIIGYYLMEVKLLVQH